MGDQSFVSQATRARVRGAITPIALAAGKVGLTPNALTVIGFLISGIAAAAAAGQAWVAAAVSSFQVSYTRAKAESLKLHGEVGIAPRAERLVLLTIGLALAGLDGGIAPGARGQMWLTVALGIIFVTASITAVQRTWHVRTQLRNEEQGAE